jgi:hypothetical protein
MRSHIAICFVLLAAAGADASNGSAHVQTTAPEAATQTLRATGTFDVVVKPLPFDDKAQDGTTGRLLVDKTIRGDLEGTSRGQMLAVGPNAEGSGAYVAIERVSGTLKGRTGTFVLQHSGWMTKAGMEMTITVVPDSGTGQLTGIRGRMIIKIEGSKHFYELEYTLPGVR